jgi:hypothetical protein
MPCQPIVQSESSAHYCSTPQTAAIERHEAWQRADQIRKTAQEPAPGMNRISIPTGRETLQIAESAVKDTQAVPAGLAAKVRTLQQDRAQTAASRLKSERHAMNPASHYHQIVCIFRRTAGIP